MDCSPEQVKKLAKRSKKEALENSKTETSCLRCGSVFTVYKSRIVAGRSKYCSRNCADDSRRVKPKADSKNKNGTKMYNGTCQCGAAFIGTYGRRYCDTCRRGRRSGSNAWNWRGGMPIARCEACGKEYTVERGSKGVVCSGKCWGAIKTKRVKGRHTSRGRGGKRSDLGDRYFRSRWEANYARYLNWLISIGQIARWEFEVDTFEFPVKRGNRFYTPDFKVWNNDGSFEYHEIKGWLDSDSKTKLKRMGIHHKQVKVVLIDKPQYRALAKQVAGFIPGWESCSKHGIY